MFSKLECENGITNSKTNIFCVDGLVQNKSIANALELRRFRVKPSMCFSVLYRM